MADLTLTGLKFGSTINFSSIQAGEALAAYDVVYLLNGKYYKADATTAAKAAAKFIVLDAADADGYVAAFPLSRSVSITIVGDTLTVGVQYVVSANAGKIAPRSDLMSNHYITELFTGSASTVGDVSLEATGIQVP